MISEKGINLIKEFEGCVLHAYKDPVGVWTIGFGHTKGVYAGQTITQEEAVQMLLDDIEVYYDNVMKYDNVYHWNQNQIDALTSFAFNIGSIDQLTQRGKRTIAEISECILLYNKAGGRVLEGLVRRREAERALFDEPTEEPTEASMDSETGNPPSDFTEAKDEPQKHFEIGKVYTVCVRSALNVRKGPGKNYDLVGYANLTADGKRHAYLTGALKNGTRVTVLEERVVSNDNVWVRIPSGWICAIDNGRILVN